jgi:hypothetical protein
MIIGSWEQAVEKVKRDISVYLGLKVRAKKHRKDIGKQSTADLNPFRAIQK